MAVNYSNLLVLPSCFKEVSNAKWLLLVESMVVLLSFLAFMSNIMFLFVVYKQPALRKTPLAVYLIIMSCIDACISLGYAVIAAYALLMWIRHSLNNKISALAVSVMIIRYPFPAVSSLLMICIAWERYKAVCRPIQTMVSPSNLFGRFIITVTSTVMLLIGFGCLPLIVISIIMEVNDLDYVYITLCLFTGILDVITIIIMVCIYYKVLRTLHQLPSFGQRSDTKHLKEQRNLTRMVVINTIVYVFLVVLQDVIVVLMFIFVDSCDRLYCLEVVMLVIHAICFIVNSGINPIIYNVFGSLYRTAFFKTFHFLKCCSLASEGSDKSGIQSDGD